MMTREQEIAYKWAMNQDLRSVAARYARDLADLVTEQSTELERLRKVEEAVGKLRSYVSKFGLAEIADGYEEFEAMLGGKP
jgi:hypothetical protein